MAKAYSHKKFEPVGGDPYGCAPVPLRQRILYAPFGLLLAGLALLPAFLSRGLADVFAFIARYVVRYRRGVVRRNLADSLPELTDKERRYIERRFYRNLADYFFQVLRIAIRSPHSLGRHITFHGVDALRQEVEQGRDVVLYTSHFGNWEYIPLMALATQAPARVVYAHVVRPLKNLWFNRFFHRLRSRFNTSVPQRQVARAMIGWRRVGQPFIIGFLSDQKPGRYTQSVVVDFLGRPTPFIEGAEVLARKLHTAVYYTDFRRIGRDRFQMHLIKVADDASALAEGELTAEYARLLTESIRRDPASYLWSHNRWRIKKSEL